MKKLLLIAIALCSMVNIASAVTYEEMPELTYHRCARSCTGLPQSTSMISGKEDIRCLDLCKKQFGIVS